MVVWGNLKEHLLSWHLRCGCGQVHVVCSKGGEKGCWLVLHIGVPPLEGFSVGFSVLEAGGSVEK